MKLVQPTAGWMRLIHLVDDSHESQHCHHVVCGNLLFTGVPFDGEVEDVTCVRCLQKLAARHQVVNRAAALAESPELLEARRAARAVVTPRL